MNVPVTRSVQSENPSVRSRPVLTLLKQSLPSAASVRRVPELRLTLLVEGDGQAELSGVMFWIGFACGVATFLASAIMLTMVSDRMSRSQGAAIQLRANRAWLT